jgi:alanine racemase
VNETCWVDISVPAFRHNIRTAKASLSGDAQLMIAVKSDAYGHGFATLAPLALEEGADQLAVLDIDTGVAVREHVPDHPLLCWLLSPHDDFSRALDASLELGISHLWQLEKLENEARGRTALVHLKIDTGLHRNGCLEKDWPALVSLAATLEANGIVRVVGIWSHLADTSIADDRVSLERFHNAVELARTAGLSPTTLHIAASAAASDLPESRLDMVRVGIIAYGVSPFDDRTAEDVGFHPVMSAHASVISLDPATNTAELGMGYADGLLPLPPNTGFVSLGGHHVPIRSVSIDTTTVSTTQYQPQVGETAVLFGKPSEGSPRAEDWADWAGTIGDEVVVGIHAHVPRHYITD